MQSKKASDGNPNYCKIAFYNETYHDGRSFTNVVLFDSDEEREEYIAKLEMKSYRLHEHQSFFDWKDGVYLKTDAGGPWCVFGVPLPQEAN